MPTATCMRSVPTGDQLEPSRPELTDLLEIATQPWSFRIGLQPLMVRPSHPRDLAAVAQMHRRCSARSLLDRYRAGGRAPTAVALDRELREEQSVVVLRPGGQVVATGLLRRDPHHGYRCAELGVLVEDAWQKRGIGADLVTHLAGVAQVAGYNELIAYPATALPAAQRLMTEVGRTRMVPGTDAHMHTYLPESATLGLGSIRQRLAG